MNSVVDEPRAGVRRSLPESGIRTRPSLPVRSFASVDIGSAERDRLGGLAERLLAEEPALGATGAFGRHVRAGLLERGPALAFEDHSALALFAQRQNSPTEYRARLLAGDGDFIAIGEQPDSVFEAYCRDILGLGSVERLTPRGEGPVIRLPLRLLRDADSLARLSEAARRYGAMSLIPYYGNGYSWLLAREIAVGSGAQVSIAAPPPRLTKRVNDKLWFADRVTEVLGSRSLPATRHAYGPAALAAELRTLARRHDRVTVKVPDSAGSLGNIAIPSEDVLSRSLAGLRDWLVALLGGLTWDGQYPLLVGVWDSPTVGSPSVQIWIPNRDDGLPVVEGIFHQVIEGSRGTFVGAQPADLPAVWVRRLAEEATRLAILLQNLGYYGRCSLDAVLAGRNLDVAELHWIECNGRWGGVSIPMTLANRLTGDWRQHPFVVVQRETERFRPRTTNQVLERLDDLLFRFGHGEQGIVLLTPRLAAEGRGLHFMAIAGTSAAARDLARDAAGRLTGAA